MATETTTEAAAHATDAVTDAAHAAETHGGGLPQLDFSTWDSQIFWLAVALAVLYLLMSRIALPRIQSTIENRADTIADDLDRAAEFKRKAEAAQAAYEAALAAARAEAGRIAAEARAAMQKELAAAIAAADASIAERAAQSEKRIQAIRDEALTSVEQVATDTAQAIVAALLPGAADEAAVAAAVRSAL
jgi:F-type H+-transporting ATPase subunit b